MEIFDPTKLDYAVGILPKVRLEPKSLFIKFGEYYCC